MPPKEIATSVQVSGLDGYVLTRPYPESWRHVLLENRTDNRIWAVRIRYDFTLADGTKTTAYKDAIGIPELGDLIPAQSRWLLALGGTPDNIEIEDTLPPLGPNDVEAKLREDLKFQVAIKLEAVLLEEGRAIGQQAKDLMESVATAMNSMMVKPLDQ